MSSDSRRHELAAQVLSKNDEVAARNRAAFKAHRLYVLNLIGSPGCGKTSILEATIARLRLRLGVIQGDIQTTLDADRVRAAGAPAVQIETHGACHLDAAMVERAMTQMPLADLDLVVIENVGNLVCPAGYDLGEDEKVAVLSVPEGDEKPAKYPALFVRAAAVVINKTDLLPYTNFSLERASADLKRLNHKAALFPLSCRTGAGLDAWCDYLRRKAAR